MEFDNSAESPRPTSFGSILDISRRRVMTSSRISRLTNLHMIGLGPFVALRVGTRWAMSKSTTNEKR